MELKILPMIKITIATDLLEYTHVFYIIYSFLSGGLPGVNIAARLIFESSCLLICLRQFKKNEAFATIMLLLA